jgi:lipopolysaccharide biosynthesis glycosyltransferase
MTGDTAICFVLANPSGETRVEALMRAARVPLYALPGLGRVVTPPFSPARRMGFGAGLRACVQSLRRRHRDMPPVIVLRPRGQEVTLADVDEVVSFDPAPYASIRRSSRYFGREVYYKLEVFTLRACERVVYLDCDTIVLDDISPLWDLGRYRDRSFYGVRESAEMGVHPGVFGKFNTGVMVINPPLLRGDAHGRMLQLARGGASYDGGDQGVINYYMSHEPGASAGELDEAYNVMVQAKKDGRWDLFENRIKILHYVNNLKPWAADHRHDRLYDREFKRLWDEAFSS